MSKFFDIYGDKTDRQTKTTQWAFTAYEDQWKLFEAMDPGIKKWGWQVEECPDTKRLHYQGYILLYKQQRFSYVIGLIPGVHIQKARNWKALLNYCCKLETRVPGTVPVEYVNDIPSHFQYAERVGREIAEGCRGMGRSPTEILHPKLMELIENIVKRDIQEGKRYAAWIASNPQWKAMWKPYGISFIMSYYNAPHASLQRERSSSQAPCEEGQQASSEAH